MCSARILGVIFLQFTAASYANPVIQGLVVNQTVEKTTQILKCVAKTNKTVKITWYHENKELSNNEYININPIKKQLNIRQVTNDNVGLYTCKVVDEAGKIYNTTIQHIKAYIDLRLPNLRPKNISLKISETGTQSLHAKCIVSSSHPTVVRFTYKGNPILSDRGVTIRNTSKNGVGTFEFVKKNVSFKDAGKYFCEAKNEFMTKQLLANVIKLGEKCSQLDHWKCPYQSKCVSKSDCSTYGDCILYNCERPSKPSGIAIKQIDHNKVSLSWKKDEKALEYTVIADTANTLSRVERTKLNHITISHLKNGTAYTLTVYGVNKVAMGDEVNLHFKTKRMVRPQIVRNGRVTKVNNPISKLSSIFYWDAPKDDGMMNKKGELRYKIQYCAYNNTVKETCVKLLTNDTSLKITDLVEHTLYTFSVCPVNLAGQEGPVKDILYRTGASHTGASSVHSSSQLLFIILLLVVVIKIFCGV